MLSSINITSIVCPRKSWSALENLNNWHQLPLTNPIIVHLHKSFYSQKIPPLPTFCVKKRAAILNLNLHNHQMAWNTIFGGAFAHYFLPIMEPRILKSFIVKKLMPSWNVSVEFLSSCVDSNFWVRLLCDSLPQVSQTPHSVRKLMAEAICLLSRWLSIVLAFKTTVISVAYARSGWLDHAILGLWITITIHTWHLPYNFCVCCALKMDHLEI